MTRIPTTTVFPQKHYENWSKAMQWKFDLYVALLHIMKGPKLFKTFGTEICLAEGCRTYLLPIWWQMWQILLLE